MNSQAKFRIALYEPRIPQNTGNIARTCAAFDLKLDLIEPLGFSLKDKYLKRAGLDYWPYVDIQIHRSLEQYLSTLISDFRIIGFSKKGSISLQNFRFNINDVLLFGREDTGLPASISKNIDQYCKINMPGEATEEGAGGVRSLNLSSAVAIASHSAGVQLGLL